MDVSILVDYISPTLIVLVLALYVIGVFLKRIPKFPDWLIPFVILALAIMFAIALEGLTADSIIQGILIAGVVVLGNELLKQGLIKRKE